MQLPSKKTVQQSLLLIGAILIIVGLVVHLGMPSVTHTSPVQFIEGEERSVNSIWFHRGPAHYHFQIDIRIWSPEIENCTITLLNTSEYERYLTGTPLHELDTLFLISNTSQFTLETELTMDLNHKILFINNNSVQVTWVYFYTAIPSTFLPSLIVAFTGIFLILGMLILRLTTHRRFFFVGLAINLVAFFIRIFTLLQLTIGIPDLIHQFLELYNDYNLFYIPWVHQIWSGIFPYSVEFGSYIYPPLFIYSIAIYGSNPAWLAGIVLFNFNIATGYLVYLISWHLTGNEKRSTVAMLIYLLNPITLIYGSFLWLNPAPYVFFVTLAFYFALTKQRLFSVLVLAMATLFKQVALIFFPLLIIALLKGEQPSTRRKLLQDLTKYTLIFCAVLLSVSLPFLLIDPASYIQRVILSGGQRSIEYLMTAILQPSYPVHFNTFFLVIGAPPIMTVPIAFLLGNYLLLGVTSVLVFVAFTRYSLFSGLQNKARMQKIMTEALFWSIILVLLVQLFFPRGSYKFYLIALMPFLAVLFDYTDLTLTNVSPFEFKKRHWFIIIITTAIFLCLRYLYFWILIAMILFYLYNRGYITTIVNSVKRIISRQQCEAAD